MGRDDWHRRTTWTAEEREFFEEKLRRARRASRPGYLRVQGSTLARSDRTELRAVGRELLRRAIVAGESDSPLEAQWARVELAEALAREGDLEDAEHWYRAAAEVQEQHGGYGLNSSCHLGLAEVLLRQHPGDPDVADEAAAALDKAAGHNPPLFHADRWRFLVALARIADARGEPERARDFAREALDVASIREPQLSRHPTVGLVDPAEDDASDMRRLAQA